jgi:hypothetical protein
MPSRFFSLVALLCLTATLQAQQEKPVHYQIFGGYSFLSNSLNGVTGSHHPLNGWDTSVAFSQWHNIRFKVDFAGYTGTNLGTPQHTYSILGGAQFSKRIGRETIFADGMAGDGGANLHWPGPKLQGQTVSFVSFIGGGLDTPISHHVAIRVDGGYQYSYFVLNKPIYLTPYTIPGLPINFGRLSSGLVFKF